MPKISVLMSAYNCGPYIVEAVSSISAQTYPNFEFLIIDDASTDDTWRKLQQCTRNDGRIRLFQNSRNLGVAHSINTLIPKSTGEYIARMDADDIALPTRFEQQVAVLDSGKADLCGGWMTVFGTDTEVMWSAPSNDTEIKAGLLFTPMFSQPTVMLRRELMEQHQYDPSTVPAEDYDLWVRMAPEAIMHNIPTPLVRYRIHPTQISARMQQKQWESAASIASKYLERTGLPFTEAERKIHTLISHPDPPASINHVRATDDWFCKLLTVFNSKTEAQRIIARMWYRYCLRAAALGPLVFWLFLRSPVTRCGAFRPWQYLAIFGLSALRVRHNSKLYRLLIVRSPASRVNSKLSNNT
ncbi:glycosyl transferase family 2 [Nitrosococcus halophilus Nc 4]|uniref:Glycosyl transferase family 2 n=1 Tax=Nitrosococcus halophilus (strain Nc4) TaxID=472759 RepID=D5BWR8_NITHN|nr:glycosyltransferase family A protein [Nitrosococcus halophilus]ADE13799.1 glycosyl transferase family 2 [Nitrosococcus halophilus Nc 4]